MAVRQRNVQCISASGLHRMTYTEWGESDNPRVLLCVHGLTRSGRDFDFLAQEMASHYRVVCPDVVGRGQSAWLKDPAGYDIPQYLADMVTLIARLDVTTVHWLGTSMGGIIGMVLASMENSPVTKLVLNDVGPLLTAESVKRIADYVGLDPTWASFDEALAYVRQISAPFGPLSEDQWRFLTQHTVRKRTDGRWGFAYDPRIADPFKANFAGRDIDLWPYYDRITCPTLVVRGAHSDILAPDTWRQMGERGPRAQLAEVAGVGHAPMFLSEDQVSIVRDFLLTA